MKSFEDLSEPIGLFNTKQKVTLEEWINWIQYTKRKERGLTNDEKSAVMIQSLRKYLIQAPSHFQTCTQWLVSLI